MGRLDLTFFKHRTRSILNKHLQHEDPVGVVRSSGCCFSRGRPPVFVPRVCPSSLLQPLPLPHPEEGGNAKDGEGRGDEGGDEDPPGLQPLLRPPPLRFPPLRHVPPYVPVVKAAEEKKVEKREA